MVRYQGPEGLLHFNVGLVGKEWLVYLPPLVGRRGEPYFLAANEASTVLSRVKNFLSRIWWFGVWPVNYQVTFVGEAVAPTQALAVQPPGVKPGHNAHSASRTEPPTGSRR